MDSSEICELVRNVFKPDKKFSFLKTNGRSFRYNWLESYLWLCYSPTGGPISERPIYFEYLTVIIF